MTRGRRDMGVTPSGEQFEIADGDLRAVIVEVGGGLRSLVAGRLEVLDGFSIEEMDHDGRGQLLLPWPNRLAGGTYTFDGQNYQVPLNEPAHDNAIHGLVRWVNWTATDRSADSVTMSHRLHPQPGYPFTLDLSARYTISARGLQVMLRAVNRGSQPCPFGAGQHPYLRVGTSSIDTASLRIPARTIHRYNDQLIPVERIPVEGTPCDFRELRTIGATAINMDYTDLERDPDGMARVLLRAPGNGPEVEVWLDQAFKHVTIYTGETVQPASRRRHSVAVEPMTCPPNAFASGQELIALPPGESWEGNWGIVIRRSALHGEKGRAA